MSMELDDRPSLGLGHLESFKSRASFLFRDSLKIARLALVDVSTAELMTEDATNADEWGPTTKAMADICSTIYNSEDYLRIVQVLHKRFALSTKKYWRQIHKSLILLEYLLCRGPEHLVMEFREDKNRLEELTRFVYVNWTGIDWGSALQRRAKHVLHLLTDEAFYKEERARAQKTSKGISGFGSQSFPHRRSPRHCDYTDTIYSHSTTSDSDFTAQLRDQQQQDYSSTLLVDESWNAHGDVSSSSSPVSSQSESRRDAYTASSSPRDGRSASGCSTFSTTSDANLHEESPTSILPIRNLSPLLDMDHSFGFGLKSTTAVDDCPPERNAPLLQKLPPPPPVAEYKLGSGDGVRVQRKQPQQPGGLKLPPPPPVAEYKLGSGDGVRVQRKQPQQPGGLKLPRVIPDLIVI